MLKEIKSRRFANGIVYALETEDGYPIEVTDTFLPYYTKNSINDNNALKTYELGDRSERWMIGVSVMSGCPVKCKFCATGQLKRWRNLTSKEILDQFMFILKKHPELDPEDSKEFKVNFTRMGEPFLNIRSIKVVIDWMQCLYPKTHCYVSTIGVKHSDFSWIKDNTTLQFSVHALNEEKRDWLIPYKSKMSLEEIGKVRTESKLKTTINMTLVDKSDFDIDVLKKYFDKEKFFIKLSPINPNAVSDNNKLEGVIQQTNLR